VARRSPDWCRAHARSGALRAAASACLCALGLLGAPVASSGATRAVPARAASAPADAASAGAAKRISPFAQAAARQYALQHADDAASGVPVSPLTGRRQHRPQH